MDVEALLKEFDKFLEENYTKNRHTRQVLVSAMRRILREGKEPDELVLARTSRVVYRRAYRLWKQFLRYKKIDAGPLLSTLRREGAIPLSRLRKMLYNAYKNRYDFSLAVLKGINLDKVYINYTENEPILVYKD